MIFECIVTQESIELSRTELVVHNQRFGATIAIPTNITIFSIAPIARERNKGGVDFCILIEI